jgi:hypothetical protein
VLEHEDQTYPGPSCFGDGETAYLVETHLGSGTVISVGGPNLFANAFLDKSDNSILAMRTLQPDGAQPVEVASAVQREMDDRAAIVAKGRTLVPNDFVVELSETDHERLDVYAESLGVELVTFDRGMANAPDVRCPVRLL